MRSVSWSALIPGLVVVLAPVVTMVLLSFCDGRFPALPWPGWSTRWYAEMVRDHPLLGSVWRSVETGLVAAILSTALGFGSGYALARLPVRMADRCLLGLTLPTLIPYVLFGICFLEFARHAGLARTTAGVVVAHTVLFSPVSAALFLHRCRQLSVELEDAARELGASESRILFQVVGGQVWRTAAASLIVVFVLSWDEYIVAWFLSGFEKTYPVHVRSMLESTMSPEVDAIGSVVAVCSSALIGAAVWLIWTEEGRGN